MESSRKTLVIRNGTLIDGSGRAPTPNEALVVDGNRVRSIGRLPGDIQLENSNHVEVIDASGQWIMPGLRQISHVDAFSASTSASCGDRSEQSHRAPGGKARTQREERYDLILLAVLGEVSLASPDPHPSLDGVWVGTVSGHTRMFVLVERAGGKILGYRAEVPGSWVVGGQRVGNSVTLQLESSDPVIPSCPGTFSATLAKHTLSGTFTDCGGVVAAILSRLNQPRTVVYWLWAREDSGDDLARARRVELPSGEFYSGGFVNLESCDFLACGGRITGWTITGTSHTITTESSGGCASTSTLNGTWDVAALLLNGSYTTTLTCPPFNLAGTFFGGKEGLSSTADIQDVLEMLRDFTDRIEVESLDAVEAFATAYVNDGKTRADWAAQLAALYAGYDNFQARVESLRQIVTENDAEVHPLVLSPSRLEWRLVVTGVPAGGGPAVPVLDLTRAVGGDEQLFWIGREHGRFVFVGNGFTAPFTITMPIQPGDSARVAFGLWPLGVHGGSHPEGHPGWDVEFAPGAQVRVAADGVIEEITPNETFPGQQDVRVRHRPGRTTQYGHLGSLEPGITVGVTVVQGQALGAAGQTGAHYITHFALEIGNQIKCPLDYLDGPGLALFETIWQTASYNEELTEPHPCNPTAVTFPLTRTWQRTSGGLSPVIEFTRVDATTIDYAYTLRNTPGGPVVESGTVTLLMPLVLPDAGYIDLQPTGGGAPKLGIYSILGSQLRIDWGAVRPADLSGASEYTTAP